MNRDELVTSIARGLAAHAAKMQCVAPGAPTVAFIEKYSNLYHIDQKARAVADMIALDFPGVVSS